MPTIPYHKPGVTYNGLHATTNPTVGHHFGLIDATGKPKGILF
jgi:hypothetical protein